MDRLSELEKEITDMRKALNERENELYELKNKWVNQPQPMQQSYQSQNQYQYQENVTEYQKSHVEDMLPRWAIERYSRQILLQDIGVNGQKMICRAKVLIVGAGGLGCPAASYLAGAGVGEIGIVDYDTVDVTNVHRQLLHSEQDQFMNKVDSAANALRRINSRITITPYHIQLDSTNVLDIVSKYNMVLDCSDNVPTRYLLSDTCVLLKVPLISGSALKMEGQLTIYAYRTDDSQKEGVSPGPCYRCLFPLPPPPETVGSCSAQGVAGPVPGVIGTLQALEAIKYITGKQTKDLMVGRMLLFDGEDCSFKTVKLRPRDASCAACSDHPTITQLLDYEMFCKMSAKEKFKEQAKRKAQRRKEEKDKRMSGQSYFGFRKTRTEDRDKWVQDVPKSGRKLGPACKSDFCAKGVNRFCNLFTECKREEIFHDFWNNMDWKSKRKYVKTLVETIPPKRRRLKHKGEVSRKGDSKIYHLFSDEDKYQVCRTTFLNTLGIKEAMVRCWLQSDVKCKAAKKPVKSINVDTYLDMLPKQPPKCTFCRSFTTKLYIDCDVRNQNQLYNKYVKDMKDLGEMPASRKTFTKVFNSKDISIFKPRNENDVCDICKEHNAINADYQTDNMQPQVFEQW